MGGMERLKRESSERLSDGTEKHDQNTLYMGRLDVEKLRCLLKNALCRYSELCSRVGGERIFRKVAKNNRQKTVNGAKRGWMASMMAITGGLVGPRTENLEKPLALFNRSAHSAGPAM